MVEVILEDKKPQQAPQHVPNNNQAPLGGKLKKDTLLVKTLAYHHPHHPARKQLTRWQQISYKDNYLGMAYREGRRSMHKTSTRKSYQGQIPSQASEAPIRSRVHLSLGWLDARTWYQWTTLLSRSYHCVLLMIRGQNMFKEGGM